MPATSAPAAALAGIVAAGPAGVPAIVGTRPAARKPEPRIDRPPMTDPRPPASPAPDPADEPSAAKGAWSGRFAEPISERVARFQASVGFDRRLAEADIDGSIAHARMLAEGGVISREDLAAIERGMAEIRADVRAGRFAWSVADEDVHLNIEKRLTALVGDAGKRLHTGRSRNDQVATDLRLWLRGEIDRMAARLRAMRTALADLAERHAETIMPGFTHLQVAQPVTFGHHLMAYEAMFARDAERLADCRSRVNRLPLGSAALPSGSRLTRRRQSRKRSASRANIDSYASRWWPNVTGCATCRCV